MTPLAGIVPPICHACGDPQCETPFGYCHCGCGEQTYFAKKKRTLLGHFKGLPVRYLSYHHPGNHSLIDSWDGSICICRRKDCSVPFGKCHCGCGRETNVATQSHTKFGHIKGQPIMYVGGHSGSSRGKERGPTLFLKIDGKPVTFVPLPANLYTIVDRGVENKFPGLWSFKNGYVTYFDPQIKKSFLVHRALLGNPERLQVDHINGNSLDNRVENLRLATHAQNCRNHKPHSSSTTKVSGVKWGKKESKWLSTITYERTVYFLGAFEREDFDLAVKARKDAERKYFGEFARAQ